MEPQVASPAPSACWPVDHRELEADEFQSCYLAYASGVRAALRARLANDLDVEDCLNRAFEKLWSRGGAIAPAARRSWLFVVARNEAALLGRKAARAGTEQRDRTEQRGRAKQRDWAERPIAGSGAEQTCRSNDLDPLESLLRVEQIERLRLAGRCLSPQQIELLRYRFVEDLPFREIAQRLAIPLGTALSRARAAIKRLRDELASQESNDF